MHVSGFSFENGEKVVQHHSIYDSKGNSEINALTDLILSRKLCPINRRQLKRLCAVRKAFPAQESVSDVINDRLEADKTRGDGKKGVGVIKLRGDR